MITVAGCGRGGDGGAESASLTTQTVRGAGFVLSAPEGWAVERGLTSVVLTPADRKSTIAAYTFRTVKPYRESLWRRAAEELDRQARALADKLNGTIVSSRTTTVAGRRARQYLFDYGEKRARLSFLYRGRREYELYCGWKAADGEPRACRLLLESFRLS